MKGKTKTILTIIIAILVFAIAVVGTVTFLRDDGEASAAEGTANTLPVTGLDDEPTNSDGEQNPTENLAGEENLAEQPEDENTEGTENSEGGTVEENTQEATESEEETTGTTNTDDQGTTVGGQTELPTITTIEQERLVSTTLNWSNISLNSTIGATGINYINLDYVIKYYQVASEEEIILLNTETGNQAYETIVEVTEEQIKNNCPTGYKLDEENSTLSIKITENVNGNIIEVYYIRDSFNLKIEYEYEDGTPASDPYEESVEFEGEYSVPSPEIPGYTPNIDVVEGTMPGEDETITVVYTPNTDVSYSVKYLEQGTEKELASEKLVENKTFDETYTETAKDITGYTVVGEATQTITLDAYNKELTFYYTKNSYDLTIEYEYEDGTPAEDPYKELVEYEKEYKIPSPEIEGYTPNIEVVEGTMPAEDETITVVYTPNTDVSYTVKYLEQGTKNELASEKLVENKTFDETYTETAKDITGYTVVGKATQTITLDTYGKVLTFYYTKNSYDLTIEYEYEDGTPASDPYEKSVKFEGEYSVPSPEIPGYTPNIDVVEGTMPAEDETITVVYTPNTDVSYTVKYLEQGTEIELADAETRTGKTFNETYPEEAKTITGYTVVGEATQTITLDAYDKVLTFYYTKSQYTYTVEYYYEQVCGKYEKYDDKTEGPIEAYYQDVISTFKQKTINGTYVLNHVEPADENGNAHLVITTDTTANVLKVYYERNTFDYKVVYYKDSVNENNYLGESEVKEQKVGTVMTKDLVTTDHLGADWINAKKPQVGYQDGVVVEYITIQANNDNVIQVVYYPRADIPYSVEYYFNGVKDTTGKNYSDITTYGTKITQVNDYSNDGEWTLDEKNSTKLPFEVLAVSGNIIRIYYVKPEIRVEKTSVVNTTRTTGAENTVEPGETITYTIKATNSGSIEGKVTIGDSIPDGTTLAEGTVITATGFDTVSKEQLEKGIELTVPANGEATVQFTVTVTENAGKDVINIPDVNGEEDEANTVTNPIEKTIEVKAKTQTIANSNIVIVLDTSISMDDPSTEASNTVCRSHWSDSSHRRAGCIEVDGTWYKPKTRMDVAKEVVNNFIDNMKLPETKTVNSCAVTVIEFNGSARVVGTADTQGTATTLKNKVTSLNMNYYTNMTSALKLAEIELKDLASERPDNTNIVIFVSDGEPTVEKNGISSAANSLKNVKLNSGKALNPTVYTVAFGSDIAILRDTIATDPTKYYTTETSGSLGNIFSSLQDNMVDFKPMQSSDGLITLSGVYADETHPIKITVNGTPLSDITTLPTDKSGYVILDNGNYYLDLTKFNATDRITIEYYSNN